VYLAGKGLHSWVQGCPSRIVRNMWGCRVKVCKSAGRDRRDLGMGIGDEYNIRIDLC
jgi:hypothetical protein